MGLTARRKSIILCCIIASSPVAHANSDNPFEDSNEPKALEFERSTSNEESPATKKVDEANYDVERLLFSASTIASSNASSMRDALNAEGLSDEEVQNIIYHSRLLVDQRARKDEESFIELCESISTDNKISKPEIIQMLEEGKTNSLEKSRLHLDKIKNEHPVVYSYIDDNSNNYEISSFDINYESIPEPVLLDNITTACISSVSP